MARYGVWAPIPQRVGGTMKWATGRAGRNITAVVIHRMEGSLEGSDSYLRKEFDWTGYRRLTASTHFAVGSWYGTPQIRQWVDTANSAWGWAARPTDVPTPLARLVLPPDLYNGSADLNWQVISVEVEGFVGEAWPISTIYKVKELLRWIYKTHGNLYVMAHTDCSTKSCPGMPTFQAALPGYYGNRLGTIFGSLPDTSTFTEATEMAIMSKVKSVAGRYFSVKSGVVLRQGPGTGYPKHWTTDGAQRYYLHGFSPNGWAMASRTATSEGLFFVPPIH